MQELHIKRDGYVRLRTLRIHPQPDLRHALDGFKPFRPYSEAEWSIHETLLRPSDQTFDFQEAPLRMVIEELRNEFTIPIVPDVQALTDAGIDLDATTVTQNLSGIRLSAALRLMLREAGLTYLIKDEVLLITTTDRAQEDLDFAVYPIPAHTNPGAVSRIITENVQAESWDTVGGPGSIRVLASRNSIIVSQTAEVHDDIERFLASWLDGDLGRAAPKHDVDRTMVPTSIHPVRDKGLLAELQKSLVTLCNSALGDAGDADAKVTVVGTTLVVQSRKRSFHVYAAELIRGFNGVDVDSCDYFGVSGDSSLQPDGRFSNSMNAGMGLGGGPGGNAFCWVAREVYGGDNPRWLAFRNWMLLKAPAWLRNSYVANGPDVATWLRDRPLARLVIEPWVTDIPGRSGLAAGPRQRRTLPCRPPRTRVGCLGKPTAGFGNSSGATVAHHRRALSSGARSMQTSSPGPRT